MVRRSRQESCLAAALRIDEMQLPPSSRCQGRRLQNLMQVLCHRCPSVGGNARVSFKQLHFKRAHEGELLLQSPWRTVARHGDQALRESSGPDAKRSSRHQILGSWLYPCRVNLQICGQLKSTSAGTSQINVHHQPAGCGLEMSDITRSNTKASK